MTINPYISRGPVRTPEMFFGREHELREMAAFLGGNQSISLVGPRKIGKTSVLFHLLRPETHQALGFSSGNLMAYLDCEVLGTSSTEEMFGQFAGELISALDEAGLPPEPALEAATAKPGRLSFETAIRRLNQRKLRVVLILDEFERLSTNPALDVNFFNALRSAAGRYQLAFITASARPLIELTYSNRAQEILSSPFFNIFAPLFLGLLSEEEARHLICEPAQQTGQEFTQDMQNFLYELAGGHPLALQVAAFHAYESPDDVAALEQATLRELDAHFQYYWRNLTPLEQETLRRLGEAASRAHSDTTLRGTLRDLLQKCLVVQVAGAYYYPSRAWAEFVGAQSSSTSNTSRFGGGLLTGTIIGPYEVLELLGRGGMAEVYKGRHTRLDRTVAIKVLSVNLAREDDFRRRFEREAQSIATLKHPNIVAVFDFGDFDGIYYMVMEYISGETLGQFLQQSGPLPLHQITSLIQDLARAIDYAHAMGIVHRDIKPSNVLLEPVTTHGTNPLGFRAVLTDFGIAKLLRGNKDGTKTDALTGTLDYMAPEQIRLSGTLDGRADVYALGVVVYQMLTGQLPFNTDNPAATMMAHLQEPAPDPGNIMTDIPAAASNAILQALAKNPDERYPTASAFAAALTGAAH